MKHLISIIAILLLGVVDVNAQKLSREEKKQQKITQTIELIKSGRFQVVSSSPPQRYPRHENFPDVIPSTSLERILYVDGATVEQVNNPDLDTNIFSLQVRYLYEPNSYTNINIDIKKGSISVVHKGGDYAMQTLKFRTSYHSIIPLDE